jgi:methane/ammonia monooxygenase subunit C
MSDAAGSTKLVIERTRGLIGWRVLALGLVLLNGFFVCVRLYQQQFGLSAGLDAFSEEFSKKWMTLLWAEIPLEMVFGFALVAYVVKTRRRPTSLTPARAELSRIFALVQWLLVSAVAYFWAASFFAEQDAAWHLVVIRDTDFTPSHIVIFYLSFPIYFILALASFLYARTRIPYFMRGYSVPFLIINSSFMILPNVALNEWGHSFWFMEEIISAPIHWGFVFFGWMILGMFGVVLQILGLLHKSIRMDDAVAAHFIDGGRRNPRPVVFAVSAPHALGDPPGTAGASD